MLVVRLDGILLPVPKSVGLLDLAVDFEGPGADFPEVNVDWLHTDTGLLRPGADLLVTGAGLLGPGATLLIGPAVVLLVDIVLLAFVEVGVLLDVNAGPEPNDDADEHDADWTLSDTVSILSSFTGTSIVA